MRANVIVKVKGRKVDQEIPIYMSEEEYQIDVYGQKTHVRVQAIGNDELTELFVPKPGAADPHQEPIISRGDCHLRYTNCIKNVHRARNRIAAQRRECVVCHKETGCELYFLKDGKKKYICASDEEMTRGYGHTIYCNGKVVPDE